MSNLYLPRGQFPVQQVFMPPDIESAVAGPWMTDHDSGLLFPSAFLEERWLDLSWNIGTFCSPSSVGLAGTTRDWARMAWSVLTTAQLESLCASLANLACILEREGFAGRSELLLLDSATLPLHIRLELSREVRAGRPWLDPRCLRWIVRELCAALAAAPFDHEEPDPDLMRAIFPMTHASGAAPVREQLTAVWLLHEDFSPGGHKLDDQAIREFALTVTTVAAIDTRLPGASLKPLSRAQRVWTVPNNHPALMHRNPKPEALRAAFLTKSGITVARWFETATALAFRLLYRIETKGQCLINDAEMAAPAGR
jgi:hypothetical protein